MKSETVPRKHFKNNYNKDAKPFEEMGISGYNFIPESPKKYYITNVYGGL